MEGSVLSVLANQRQVNLIHLLAGSQSLISSHGIKTHSTPEQLFFQYMMTHLTGKGLYSEGRCLHFRGKGVGGIIAGEGLIRNNSC